MTTELALIQPAEQAKLDSQITAFVSPLMDLKVSDAPSYQTAARWLVEVKNHEKAIKDFFDPHVKRANEAHKALTQDRKRELDKLAPAEAHLKGQISAYLTEQARLQKIEQDRLDAIQKAEQKKLDDARKAEQDRLDAEAAAVRKAEEDRRAAAAAEAKRKGDEAEAARLAALPPVEVKPAVIAAPAPVLQRVIAQSAAPKVTGVAPVLVWLFEVTDALAVPREFLMVDESKIRQRVQALKGAAQIPGVRVYSETQTRAQAKR